MVKAPHEESEERPKAPMGSKTLALTEPIMVEDVMRRYLLVPLKLNLGDLQSTDAGRGDVEKAIFLIAKLAKIPVASAMAIDAMDIQETSELGRYIKDFL